MSPFAQIEPKSVARRRQIVWAIARLTRGSGMPPTLRELADDLDMSDSTILYHVTWLRKAGILRQESGSRNLVLADGAEFWREGTVTRRTRCSQTRSFSIS